MEEEKERWWENREQESEKDKEKRRRKSSYHTQNHTAMKSERENMEANLARQVLSKSVSCNWETGDYHWGPAL